MDNSTAVIVNGESIGVREVLHGMKVRQGAQFLEAAIQDALIRQAAGKDATVSDGELQEAADDLRRSMGLFDAEATHQWLKQSGISVEDLEEALTLQVLTQRVRDQVTKDRVDEFFSTNRANLDRAAVSRIVVAEEGVAAELVAQVAEEGADFAGLAREYSLDEGTRLSGGYAGSVGRSGLGADAEALVFGASAGQVVGPVKTEGGWMVLRVENLTPAELDDATREQIKDSLFHQWLQEQRGKAKVETPILGEV